MRRIVAIVVLAAVVAAPCVPRRAFAGPPSPDVELVGEGPGGVLQYRERLGQGRQFWVTTARTVTWEEYRAVRSVGHLTWSRLVLRDQFSLSAIGREVGSLLGRFFNDSKLFVTAFVDVWKATEGTLVPGKTAGMENMRDVAKRYEFWDAHGFYDRYTARERAYINRVVFPAVCVARAVYGAGGMSLAVAGLAAWLGVGIFPLALGGLALWGGLTAYKVYRVYAAGAELPALVLGPPEEERIGGFGQAWLGSGAGFLGAAVEAGGAVIAASGIGVYMGADASYDMVRLWNAWGIPEPELQRDEREKIGEDVRRERGEIREDEEWRVDYRLSE